MIELCRPAAQVAADQVLIHRFEIVRRMRGPAADQGAEAGRQAFDATMREPAFLKEAESMGFEVVPQSGKRIAALVATALATPKDIVKLAERATQSE